MKLIDKERKLLMLRKKKANTCRKEEKVNCWNFFHAALLLKAEQDISFQKCWESLKIIVLSHTKKQHCFMTHFSWCWLKSVIWNPLLFSSFLMCPQWCSGHDTPFKLLSYKWQTAGREWETCGFTALMQRLQLKGWLSQPKIRMCKYAKASFLWLVRFYMYT